MGKNSISWAHKTCLWFFWVFSCRYRDGGTNHHTSILSLPETYEAGDNYYDALAKNMDANLAEADMESFKTEDIHALLTNLPPMCTDQLSQEVRTNVGFVCKLPAFYVPQYGFINANFSFHVVYFVWLFFADGHQLRQWRDRNLIIFLSGTIQGTGYICNGHFERAAF